MIRTHTLASGERSERTRAKANLNVMFLHQKRGQRGDKGEGKVERPRVVICRKSPYQAGIMKVRKVRPSPVERLWVEAIHETSINCCKRHVYGSGRGRSAGFFGKVCHPQTTRIYSRFGFAAILARLPHCYFRAMAAQQDLPNVPNVQFRVLIIGKANAGKTSILQRVCDTTESPEIYSVDSSGARNQVRSRYYWLFQSHRLARFNSALQ